MIFTHRSALVVVGKGEVAEFPNPGNLAAVTTYLLRGEVPVVLEVSFARPIGSRK